MPIQLPHRTLNFVERLVDYELPQTSESRRHAAARSADAMGSHGYRGGAISGRQPSNAREMPERPIHPIVERPL
jgi:hypothetical protein